MGILVKCGEVHEIRLDTLTDLSTELSEDVEAAVIHVRPKIDGCLFGDEAENVADGRGGVTHETQSCLFRVACSVGASEFMEGGEVFDAEHGFSVDGDFLKGCDLRRGESYGRCEGVQVDDLTIDVGEFPISGKVNITGVGDEVEFS